MESSENPINPSTAPSTFMQGQIRALFESSLDAMLIADDAGRCLDVNPAACELLGRSPEDLLGCYIVDFTEPGFDYQQAWQNFQQEQRVRGELRLVHADGSIRVVEYTATANFLPHQHLAILRDITERKRAEAEIWTLNQRLEQRVQERTEALERTNNALRQEIQERQNVETSLRDYQQRLQSILSSIEGVVWSVSADREQVLYMNPVTELVFGRPVSEFVANPQLWLEVIHPEDRPLVEKAIATLLAVGTQAIEYRIIRPDGQVRWLHDRARVVYDREGQPLRIDGIATDISDLKQTEAALRQSEATNRAIVEALPDLLFYLDRQGTYLTIQTSGQVRLFNPAHTQIGNRIFNTLPTHLAQQRLDYIQAALDTQKLQVYEYSLPFKDETRYEEARIVPMDDDKVLVLVRDISEREAALRDRKRAEEALRESETQLRLLTDTLPVCISYTDRSLRYRFVNRTYEQWFGVRREDLYGCALEEVIGSAALAELQGYINQALAGETVSYEAQVPYRLGGQRYISASLVPDLDERSQVRGYYALISDISERKRAEIELEETRNFLQSVLDNLPVAVYVKDAQELRFVLWNAATTELLGYSATQAVGKTDFDLFRPQQAEICTTSDREVLSGRKIVEVLEEQIWSAQGTPKIIRNKKVGVYDPAGEPQYIIGFAEDISDRKRAEAALQESEARFRAIFEQAAIGIVVSTPDGHLIQMNERFSTLIGYNPQTDPPLHYKDLTSPEDEQQESGYWQALLAGEISTYTLEREYCLRSGDRIWVNVSVSLIRNAAGEPLYALGLVEDIGERKQVEAVLRQQVERESVISAITNRIRRSLNLQEILNTTVTEVRHILNADRALIFRLYPDDTGSIIAESVLPAYPLPEEMYLANECFPPECYEYYRQGKPRIILNVETDQWACLGEFMQKMGVKSKIVAPITQHDEEGNIGVWGLLIIHACAVSRDWQDTEADLLKKISNQLAIAIQQAELCHKLQGANQELNRLASIDGLTQIANRRHFGTSLAQEWQRLQRERSPLSLILCDIDYFKPYNDRYGHLAGDRCLQQVAQALHLALKRPADLVARYGGEEFVAILPNTDCAGAIHIAEQIQNAIAALNLPHCCSQVSDRITVSLGIASQIPTPNLSSDDLIAAADLALYQAKSQGRNRYCIAL